MMETTHYLKADDLLGHAGIGCEHEFSRANRTTSSSTARIPPGASQHRSDVWNRRTCGHQLPIPRQDGVRLGVRVVFRSRLVCTAPGRRSGVWRVDVLSGCSFQRPSTHSVATTLTRRVTKAGRRAPFGWCRACRRFILENVGAQCSQAAASTASLRLAEYSDRTGFILRTRPQRWLPLRCRLSLSLGGHNRIPAPTFTG
jgi:hypothetical protein